MIQVVGLSFILLMGLLKTSYSFDNEITKKPNIIFILADDLGFNDVSFRGSSQIMTPNIDALAFSGIILDQYYVQPLCTPSRSALMTGKYPIHTGMQHYVLLGMEPRGLPLSEKLLPQYLKDLGYKNHMIGKWHLGHYKKEYTPIYRGFDSHYGYWGGHQDYFDHTLIEDDSWGFDMRRNMEISYDSHGKYLTDILTKESIKVIENHNSSDPLFLYIAHGAVHGGNAYHPIPAPDDEIKKMSHIKDFSRQQYAAMTKLLDDSVGDIIKTLDSKNMLENSIIIFSTDNGGANNGIDLNAGSNWPLRGLKYLLFEGGVRGAGLIWSPLINKTKRKATQMFHITDWLPTLYNAAGGNPSDLPTNLDGLDLWKELINDEPSKRREILHNLDPIENTYALTIGNLKLMKGTIFNGKYDGWLGDSGDQNPNSYDINLILNSSTGQILNKMGYLPTSNEIYDIRSNVKVNCGNHSDTLSCNLLEELCLFDLRNDPCELDNLAKVYPYIVYFMKERIDQFISTSVQPGNRPLDKRGDPKYWNYVWTNFGDLIPNYTAN